MQTFHRSANALAKVSIAVLVLAIGLLTWLGLELFSTSYVTHQGEIISQPVPFSHQHHVSGLGLDCRYCHTTVEKSPIAGVPPTQICMNCHKQVWAASPTLERVRASLRENRPIQWARVNNLPDFVYFDHSIHIHKGVG